MSDNRKHLDAATTAALGLWVAVGSLAIILTGRALAGAFDEPVGSALPLLATSIALVASLTAWSLFHSGQRRDDPGRRLWDGCTAIAPAGMIAFATSVNAAPQTLAAVSSLLVGGLAYLAVREAVRNPPSEMKSGRMEQSASSVNEETSHESSVPQAEQMVEPVDEPEADPVSAGEEQLSRRSLAGGGEQIEAVLLARFEPGRRQTAIHLPIHPVLSTVPDVECEPLDDSPVTTQVSSVHTYGVRVEVKRSGDSEAPSLVPIGVLITTTSRGIAAA